MMNIMTDPRRVTLAKPTPTNESFCDTRTLLQQKQAFRRSDWADQQAPAHEWGRALHTRFME